MEVWQLIPASRVDTGSAKCRLSPWFFLPSLRACKVEEAPLSIGDFVFVQVASQTRKVYLCTAWPIVVTNQGQYQPGQVASFDPFVSVDVSQTSSLYDKKSSSDSRALAWVYGISSWTLLFPNCLGVPPDIPLAREIHVQFLGEAVRNLDTSTLRRQIAALLESLNVISGAVVSPRRDISSAQIGGLKILSVRVEPDEYSPKLPSLKSAFLRSKARHQTLPPRPAATAFIPARVSVTTRVVVDYSFSPHLEDAVPNVVVDLKSPSWTQDDRKQQVRRRLNVGGLKSASRALVEMLELPLRYPDAFVRLGMACPKGILLHGPPGTGKTLLVREVSRVFQVPLLVISSAGIYGSSQNDPAMQLKAVFDRAERLRQQQSKKDDKSVNGVVIFIDEIDAICPKRDDVGTEENRLIAQLLMSIEETKVVVVAATNRPHALDPALRRPNRFDREIEIGLPTFDERLDILSVCTQKMAPQSSDIVNNSSTWTALLTSLAQRTPGWSGADLSYLVRDAVLRAATRMGFGSTSEHQLSLQETDFEQSLKSMQSSSHRGWIVDVPKVTWDDVGGLESVRQTLKMLIEWPVQHADTFRRLGVQLPCGILFHGPPGCSKTSLVRVVANCCNAAFFSLSGAEIDSRFVGEAERKIRALFSQARAVRPSIIFFDEIDAIATKRYATSYECRNRVLTQLLTEMDGIGSSRATCMDDLVLVVGATNRLDQLDPAILRPGRFDAIIQVHLPDCKARKEIFRVHTRHLSLDDNSMLLDVLAEKTDGMSGADIANLCKEAALSALRENIEATNVRMDHFLQALKPLTATMADTQ